MYISAKKFKKLQQAERPHEYYMEWLQLVAYELLRCGEPHYKFYPEQVAGLQERIYNDFDRIIKRYPEISAIYSSHFRAQIWEDEGSYDISFSHVID